MANITIQNVTKRFGSTIAVKDMTLTVNNREFVVIVGPTGAGKTTTLRCVAGLETPEQGTILMDGKDMAQVSPAGRDLAFVFQNYALYPRKTVFENIAFPLQARKLAPAEIQFEVERVARMLNIHHLLQRRPAQLSGGEQQRVALGRAMVRTPRAFLMDEPLTNLDFQLRARMRSELKRLQQELDATFLYVTNDQIEALSMGDRIAVLNEGVLQQVGPPQEVYDHPVNLFVARFIGSIRMNFLPCTYHSDRQILAGQNGAWQVRAPERLRAAAASGKDAGKLILGVRPEDVILQPEAANGDLQGRVYVVEPMGNRNIYDVQLGSELIKVKTSPIFHLEPDTQVSIHFNLERVHLFDATTEQALV